MPKQSTTLRQQYKKEYTRLRQGFYRYKKEGYAFPIETLQQNPKKVTRAMVENLKQIKPKQLTAIAERMDIETGEILEEEKKKSLRSISKIKTERKKPTTTPKPKSISTPPLQITYEEPEEYIPTLTILDAIRDAINALPNYTQSGKGVQISNRKNSLLSILDDTVNSLSNETYQQYEQYLMDNQHTIFSQLETIKYESKEEKVDASFALVARILNGGRALTAMQAESVSYMQEMY